MKNNNLVHVGANFLNVKFGLNPHGTLYILWFVLLDDKWKIKASEMSSTALFITSLS